VLRQIVNVRGRLVPKRRRRRPNGNGHRRRPSPLRRRLLDHADEAAGIGGAYQLSPGQLRRRAPPVFSPDGHDQQIRAPVIDMARATEGARMAARIIREQRLRDLNAAIAEFWRASGPDRDYWRGQAGWLIREWRRVYQQPEAAAFQAAVERRATP